MVLKLWDGRRDREDRYILEDMCQAFGRFLVNWFPTLAKDSRYKKERWSGFEANVSDGKN